MAQSLLPDRAGHVDQALAPAVESLAVSSMADLKIFWGPEICRIEYLIHLLETGRVKDDRRPRNV
jgi:hypothetical protein